jgi:peptide/nickel transport system substrate-binding protein
MLPWSKTEMTAFDHVRVWAHRTASGDAEANAQRGGVTVQRTIDVARPRHGERAISRRSFLMRWGKAAGFVMLAELGLATPAMAAQSTTAAPASVLPTAASSGARAAPSRESMAASAAPAVPALRVQANADQTLRMLLWQAPTILNPYLAQGLKDLVAARCCLEPLLTVDNAGELSPVLAAEVPTRSNGGLPDDRTVIYRLKPGVMWADSQPFTADDVVFTFELVSNKETAATNSSGYLPVERVEALDDLTVKLTFKQPTAGWHVPFVGTLGMVLPRHAFVGYEGVNTRNAPFNLAAFGTGPYMVDTFLPGDLIVYMANPLYRESGKPYFGRFEIKGGGDPVTAARTVFQTGEFDYAWNLQIETAVLQNMMQSDTGELLTSPGLAVEQVFFNQADPNQEIDGERSHPSTRHPFLADQRVREALALAIDRTVIATQLYGPTGDATSNVLTVPTQLASPNTTFELNIGKANAMLDAAGYAPGADGVRVTPDGIRMKMLFTTTVGSVRQKQQAIIKDGWQKIGVETELKAVDAGIFFGSSPDNPDTSSHFYADVEMLAGAYSSPFPSVYMKRFYGRDPLRDWAQKANNWSTNNSMKWRDPTYDDLYDAALTEMDPDKNRELWQKLNDIVVASYVSVPLVDRKVVAAKATTLRGPDLRAFEADTWNIADWAR